jgi:hypothetical protein
MAQVNQDALLVHPFDQPVTEPAQAGVRRLQAPVTSEVPAIIRELDDADSELVEQVEPAKVLTDRRRILEPVDQTQTAIRLRRLQIRHGLDLDERVGVSVDFLFPVADRLERLLKSPLGLADGADRQVDGGKTAIPGIGDIGGRQRVEWTRIRHRGPRATERVDDNRSLVAIPPEGHVLRITNLACKSTSPESRGQCKARRRQACERQETPSVEHANHPHLKVGEIGLA